MKIIVSITLFFAYSLLPGITSATNIDSLLLKFVNASKPYLIINVPSSDCISCRGAAGTALSEIKMKIPSDKVFLLSDDKIMRTYFNKFPEMYGGYKVIYKKELSEGMTDDLRSKLCVITDKGVSYYSLPIASTTLAEITSLFNSTSTNTNKVLVNNSTGVDVIDNANINDTLFSNTYMSFEANPNMSVLYNEKFQIGSVNTKNKIEYREPELDDTSISFLYRLLSQYVQDSFQTIAETKKTLKPLTIPLIYIKSFRIVDNQFYVLFKFNTAYDQRNTKPNERKVSVFGRFLFARIPIKNKSNNPYNLSVDNCQSYSWLDTVHQGSNLYMPLVDRGFDVIGDTIFMPVVKTDNAGNILNDNEVSIMSYRFIDNKKLNYLQVYNSPYSIKRTNRYLVRARDGKSPFIVNRDSKSVVLIREEKEINLDKNLSEIFDVSFINEKLCFVGIDQQGKAVQGAYSTIGKTINIIPLNTPIPFPNATISKSTIYSYRKDDEANKLLFESFRIPAR